MEWCLVRVGNFVGSHRVGGSPRRAADGSCWLVMLPIGACRPRERHIAESSRTHNRTARTGIRRRRRSGGRPRCARERGAPRLAAGDLGAIREPIRYPARMSFSPEELDLIDRTVEVEIETQAPDGPSHRTVIWAVVDE